jgi:hemolysin activation/secretion protein
MIVSPGRALLLMAAMLGPADLAVAQTSVRGVPSDRPDQKPAPTPPQAAPLRPALTPRAPDAPIAPFVLEGVVVEGSSLPREAIAAAYAPFLGRSIDNAGLTAITNAVASAYAKSDIALYTVLVPEQRFAGGALRLTVVEGYVGAVEVRGALRRTRLKLLRTYLRRLEQERPLHRSTLERVVSLIRDMPGFLPEITLEPGSAQGAVKLVMNARERPVQAAFGLNDRGTALLGRTQVQADTFVNAIFGGADQLRLSAVLPTKVSRFQYVAGAYSTPLDADGTSVTANLSYLRTRPSAFPLKGDAKSFGLQFSRAIVRGYSRNLTVTVGVDGINSNNALLGFTLSNDRIRTLRGAVSFVTVNGRNQFSASATASLGLDVLGMRVAPGQARRGFRKFGARVSNARTIGKSFALRLAAFGQTTPDDLPSSEQVALGGDEFGRAYEAAIISGDRGIAGSAEFAFRPVSGLPKQIAGSELYAFTDAGRVHYRSRFGFAGVDSRLASVGAGGRLQIAQRTIVQLEAVRGLDNPVFYTDRKKTRLLFSIRSLL